MYSVRTTKNYERAFKKCVRRGLPMDKLDKVVKVLEATGTLPQKYRPHKLSDFAGNNVWECHIQPDWLLVWQQFDEELVLLMLDTGTHSDIF